MVIRALILASFGFLTACGNTGAPPDIDRPAVKKERVGMLMMEDEFQNASNAYRNLSARPDIAAIKSGKVDVLEAGDKKARWTFATVDHPAYPAVVRQMIVNINGDDVVELEMLCNAAGSECTKFFREVSETSDNFLAGEAIEPAQDDAQEQDGVDPDQTGQTGP